MRTASTLLNIDSAGLWNAIGRMEHVVPKKDYFFPVLVQNLPQIISWAEVTVKAAACNSKWGTQGFGLNSHLTVITVVPVYCFLNFTGYLFLKLCVVHLLFVGKRNPV